MSCDWKLQLTVTFQPHSDLARTISIAFPLFHEAEQHDIRFLAHGRSLPYRPKHKYIKQKSKKELLAITQFISQVTAKVTPVSFINELDLIQQYQENYLRRLYRFVE